MSFEQTKNGLKNPEELLLEVGTGNMKNVWIDEFGVVYSQDKKRLLKAPININQYQIKEGTQIISNGSFSYCEILKNITLPDTITTIEPYAFCDCKALTNIILPESIYIIDEFAFCNCTALHSITISNSLKIMGKDIFYNCNTLTNILLSNDRKTINKKQHKYSKIFKFQMFLKKIFVFSKNL